MTALFTTIYFLISLVFFLGVTYHLSQTLPNGYTMSIGATKGAYLFIYINMLVVSSVAATKLAIRVLFGELRLIEQEHINERLWPAVISLGVALGIYTDRLLTVSFLGMLVVVGKVFSWIVQDRLEMLIQKAQNDTINRPILNNVILRSPVLFSLLMLKWHYMVISVCLDAAIHDRQEVMLIIGFEWVLLSINLLKNLLKFFIQVKELHYIQQNPDEEIWEPKNWWMTVVDLVVHLALCVLTPVLFVMFISFGVIPLNLVGEIFLALVGFAKSGATLARIRRMQKQLLQNVQDPTIEDIEKDDLCIICRDEMELGSENLRMQPKKLSCGHVLHFGCLKSWLERAKGCPVCRRPVMEDGNDVQRNEIVAEQPQQPEVPAPQLQAVDQPMEVNNSENNAHNNDDAHDNIHTNNTNTNNYRGEGEGEEVQEEEKARRSNATIESISSELRTIERDFGDALPQLATRRLERFRLEFPRSTGVQPTNLDWTVVRRYRDENHEQDRLDYSAQQQLDLRSITR